MIENQRERSKTAKAGLAFQVSKVENMLRQERYLYGYNAKTAIYLAAVLEYVVCELFECAALKTFEEGKRIVTGYHFVKGIANDPLLYQLLGGKKSVIAHKKRGSKRRNKTRNKLFHDNHDDQGDQSDDQGENLMDNINTMCS